MASRSRSTGASDKPADGEEAPPTVGDATDTSGTEDPGGESPGAAGAGDDGDVMEHAPEPAPEPSPIEPAEKVPARVMVSGLWGNRAGTKILQRDEIVVVDSDDSRLGEGKPLAKFKDQAADPDVASTLAALADS